VAPEDPASSTSLEAQGAPSEEAPKSQSGRRTRSAEASRQHLREVAESLGPRELDTLVAFAEFLKARRAARGFAHHFEHQREEREVGSSRKLVEGAGDKG
jgi:hypothetical protein